MPIFSKHLLCWLALLPALAAADPQKFARHFPANDPKVPAAVLASAHGQPWQNRERGPVEGLREFAREKSGAIWLGGDQGAARFDPKAKHPWDRWQYFFGKRWLQDDAVRNIRVTENGKTLDEAKGSLRRGIENIEHACGIPTLMMGKTLEDVASAHHIHEAAQRTGAGTWVELGGERRH